MRKSFPQAIDRSKFIKMGRPIPTRRDKTKVVFRDPKSPPLQFARLSSMKKAHAVVFNQDCIELA